MRDPARTREACDGFTLLEVLVALVFMVLVVTVVVPWFEASLVRLRAEAAAEDVVAAVSEARGLAVGRNRVVRLYVDEKARSVEVEGGHYRRLSDDVTLSGPPRGSDGKGVILFHPDGTSSGGQVIVSTGSVAWAMSVEVETGGVRRVYAGAE